MPHNQHSHEGLLYSLILLTKEYCHATTLFAASIIPVHNTVDISCTAKYCAVAQVTKANYVIMHRCFRNSVCSTTYFATDLSTLNHKYANTWNPYIHRFSVCNKWFANFVLLEIFQRLL